MQVFAIISVFLSFLAVIFNLVGSITFSQERATVKHTAWATENKSSDVKAWLGLRELILEENGATAIFKFEGSDDQACEFEFCVLCEESGKVAFGLLILAALLSLLTGLLAFPGNEDNPTLKKVGIAVTSLLTAISDAASFGIFGLACYKAIEEETAIDLAYGPGSILPLFSFSAMSLVFILNLFDAAFPAKPQRR
jgi:hypothetical protein